MIGIQVPRAETGSRWTYRLQPMAPLCACGCGEQIQLKPQHRCPTKGIPRYIRGHHPNPLRRLYAPFVPRVYCSPVRSAGSSESPRPNTIAWRRQGSSRSHGGGASAPARDAGVRAGECGQDAGGAAAISQPGVEDSTCPHDSATSRVGCGSLTAGRCFESLSGSHPMSPPTSVGFDLTAAPQRSVEASRSSACIRGQLREPAGPVLTVVALAEITIARGQSR